MSTDLVYRKQIIVSKIEQNLTHIEHGEIFKILQKHNVPFTKNKNGCFFNIAPINSEMVSEIERFVEYCQANKQNIEDYNKRLDECKLKGTISQKKDGSVEADDNAVDEDDDDDDEFEEDDDTILSEDAEEQDVIEAVINTPAATVSLDRKKTMTKFVIAKKRFGKKSQSEHRVDYDVDEILLRK